MGLPRGRRWVDQPRKPAPMALQKLQAALAAANDPGPTGADALALREQLHREADAKRHAQGVLKLTAPA